MNDTRRTLGVIVLAGLATRVLLLLLRGDYIVFDEGYYLLLARSLREQHTFALNGLPHVALSPLQPLLVALLSLPGWSDLWVSRLLGALCGSLLAIPVWSLAQRIGGPRSAAPAALFTVLAPSMMSYLPFFPGEGWNLYFGSEPLFLLLALSACAIAARAAEDPRPAWFVSLGVLAGGAFLARAEGVILAPLVMVVLGAELLRTRQRVMGRWLLAVLAAALVSAPYLLYLHSTLGRWAFSGRVQAAAVSQAPAASTRATAQRGGSVLEDFVWGGDQARFRAELYGLTPDGLRMQSQYWGVDRSEPGPALAPAPADSLHPPSPAPRDAPSFAGMLMRAVFVVVPWWLAVLGLIGLLLPGGIWPRLWLVPLVVAALLPAFAAYVEPRSLLPLLPVMAIGAARALAALVARLSQQRPTAARAPAVMLALLTLLLLLPTAGAAWRSRLLDTPLQQLAAAQRTVGQTLGANLAPDVAVMSWHPAVALYAGRDWRVMPEAPLQPLLRYAQRRAGIVVFSRFHPSPLSNPPKPFTAILLGDSLPATSSSLTLEQVESTALLFVGRLAAVP